MILAIDIGNTRTTYALMREMTVVAQDHTPSGRTTFRRALDVIRKLCNTVARDEITAVGIASVVPLLTDLCRNASAEITGRTPIVVSHQSAGLKTGYLAPETIGADRLCNAIAAYHAVSGAAIVIDCGTAVTLDCIASDGAFLGGAILPGYRSASRALSNITAQLPEIELLAPTAAVGTSTDECLRSGIVFGTTAAIEGLLGRMIFETYGDSFPALIATGGHAELFATTTSLTVQVMPDLVLQGVALVAGTAS